MQQEVQYTDPYAACQSITEANSRNRQFIWHVLYTRPRYEFRICEFLSKAGIETFVPLYTTVRQWSDRKKKINEPLFSGYVFVRIQNKDYYPVLNLYGVIRYISCEGKAIPISEKQIALIRASTNRQFEPEALKNKLAKGKRVEINYGSLCGITGELIDYYGKTRVIITLNEIKKSVLVNIPINYLKLIE